MRQKIEADLKQAMLEKRELERDTLRMAKSELLNEEVKLGRDLTDAESLAVLTRGVKSRKDSIEQYRAGGREEAAQKEEAEIEILARYLPKLLGEAETRTLVQTLISELGISAKKDLGRLMKELKEKHEGVDPKIASRVAGELLA